MTVSRSGTLLAVIDMQRVFAETDSPWCVPGFAGIVSPIERLVQAFGDRVVFTRFIVPAVPEGSWVDYYREWGFILQPGAKDLLDLTSPWAGRDLPVIDKPTFSAFGAELREHLGRGETLVLCGVSTECCVLATALEAVDAGISVRLVTDACASVSQEAHEAALLVAQTGFAPMVTITSVEEELRTAHLSAPRETIR
jgi:nicotinamidase-related amidase